MRTLIVGGFEPSGHDALAAAIEEAGIDRGHHVVNWHWRDRIDLADHVLFRLHHLAGSRDASWLAGLLDSPLLPEALGADLERLLTTDFDVIVSVHPWSTIIVGRALSHADSRAFFVDLTADFTPFPVVVHSRVDAYLGPGPHRALPPRVRDRSVRIGLPVRKSFVADMARPRRNTLVATAGASAWLIEKTARCLPAVVNALRPSSIIALAPSDQSADKWRRALQAIDIEADIPVGLTDTGALLTEASWLLTKASGPAVAEGLAAGCTILAVESGVFWEDEARAYLSADRVVVPVVASDVPLELIAATMPSRNRELFAVQCRVASSAVWDTLERGLPANRPIADISVAAQVEERLQTEQMLPATTAALSRILAEWVRD